MMNKKAVSILIGYVLLISFAIIMGTVIYGWLEGHVAPPLFDCPEGTSLFIKSATCNLYDLELVLDLENNGRFDIAGYFIHGANKSNQELATVDLSQKFNPGNGYLLANSIIFGEEMTNALKPDSNAINRFTLDNEIYSLEITPIRYQTEEKKVRIVSCGDAKIKNKIECTNIFNPLFLNGIVSWWKFDGDTNDAMGLNNGEINNDVDCFANGISGYSCRFEGDDDYINISDSSSLDITGEISIAAWVNSSEPDRGNSDTIINKLGGNTGYKLSIVYDSCEVGENNLQFEVDSDAPCNGNNNITTNQWNYFVVTANSTGVYYYKDGVLNETDLVSPSISLNNEMFYIGGNGSSSEYFKGELDEVMIFNRTLTSAEVSQLYDYFT